MKEKEGKQVCLIRKLLTASTVFDKAVYQVL